MCNSVDDSQKHAEQQNSDTREQVLYIVHGWNHTTNKASLQWWKWEAVASRKDGRRGTGKYEKNILYYHVTVGYLGVYT